MSSRENLKKRRAKLQARVERLDAKIAAMGRMGVMKCLNTAAGHAEAYTDVPFDGCKTVLRMLSCFDNMSEDYTDVTDYVRRVVGRLSGEYGDIDVFSASIKSVAPDVDDTCEVTLTFRCEMDELILRHWLETDDDVPPFTFVTVDKSDDGLPMVKFYHEQSGAI